MRRLVFALVTLAMLAVTGAARAEMVRYRFVPADNCGAMRQVPTGPNGAMGELFQGFGLRPPQPFPYTFRTTHMVTFRHSNGRNVTVPLALPEANPRIETRADRIVYT